MDRIREIIIGLITYIRGLPPHRRTYVMTSVPLSVALAAGIWGWATYDPYVALFDQPMDPKSTNEVIQSLKADDIPYRLERGTNRVLIPDTMRDQVAVTMRGGILHTGREAGLELLEDNKFGSTRFVEHVRWVRGLQGEIERQINGFDQVMGSKVLLSIPETSLFEEDQEAPSASVYVELKSGTTLGVDEGRRMAALVAAAVPRLRGERVEILDSEMRIIHAALSADEETSVAGRLADLSRHYEKYYQGKIETLLGRIVGAGNVVARVSVELDHSERSTQQRDLDGDRAVTISTRSRESSTMGGGRGAGGGGVPGTTSNIPEIAQAGQQRGGSSATEADELANVDVPEKLTTSASLPGGIVGVTAAVVVNGLWDSEPVAGADVGSEAAATPTRTYTPRTAEELDQFRQLVAQTIGASVANVTVINQPFDQVEYSRAAPAPALAPGVSWTDGIRYGFGLIAMVMVFFFIVKPLMRQVEEVTAEHEAMVARAAAAGTDGGPTGALSQPGTDEVLAEWLDNVSTGGRHVTRDEVDRLVGTDIDHTVVTLQAWIAAESE